MLENIDVGDLLSTYVIPWGINIVLAAVIFFIGRMVSKIVVNIIRRLLVKAKMEAILINFVCSILSAALLLLVIIAALNQLGVNTT